MSRKSWLGIIVLILLIVVAFGATLIVPLLLARAGGAVLVGPGMMSRFGFPFFRGGIYMLLFWVLIIIGGVLVFQSLARGNAQSASSVPVHETPLDIVRARYARGEISKEQYEELKRDLGA